MIEHRFTISRVGLGPGLVSIALAGANTAVIAFDWTNEDLTIRIALGGLAIFAVAVVLGSSRLVGAAAGPMVGAAIIGAAEADHSVWLAAGIWGTTYYAASELAWHSLERRRHGVASAEVARRRIVEVTTVVAVSLALTATALVLSSGSPVRVAWVQGILVALGVVGLVGTRRSIRVSFAAASDRHPAAS